MSIRKKTNIESYLVKLQDYPNIREIGHGGYGTVYLIEDKGGNRRAAKVIRHYNSDDESKFIPREIGILIRVNAPTITCFYGFSLEDFQGNPNVTIVMEYYEHGSLHQLIEKEIKGERPPEYNPTVKQIILCGIAHGMMILHSNRVLHRDLNPGNVLLDKNFHPHITDFGLSKFLDSANPESQSRAECGTAAYMSPEVIEDTHYSLETDVYSFGILMFEVLTGQLAFSELRKKKKSFQLKTQVTEGERPTFNVPIKPSFKKLIEQCWSQNPKERPTFRELFNKLSLSPDDETIESALQDMIFGENQTDEETDPSEYLLDGVDANQLFQYIDEITNERTEKEKELQQQIEEQNQRFNSIIEQQQQKIDQLQSENQKTNDILRQLLGPSSTIANNLRLFKQKMELLKRKSMKKKKVSPKST